MSNSYPKSLKNNFCYKIAIICEGCEEYEYMQKLISLNVWQNCYSIELINAEGSGNIPAWYQYKYQIAIDDAIFIFCDTDKAPYDNYSAIKKKIDDIYGVHGSAENVIIFGNPCTMQIILLHFCDIILSTQAKKTNAEHIKRLTGITDYKAQENQRKVLFNKITVTNYNEMRSRIEKLNHSDNVIGSSNFNTLLDNLHNKDGHWIKSLNKYLNIGHL